MTNSDIDRLAALEQMLDGATIIDNTELERHRGGAVVSAHDVVAVIHAHQYKGNTTEAWDRPTLVVRCSCGHEAPCESRRGRIVHSAHVVDALTAAGYLIVSPPVPSAVNYPGIDKATVKWADGQVLVNGKGCGKVRVYLDDHRLTPTEAREVGAGLFAGAAHAEAGEGRG